MHYCDVCCLFEELLALQAVLSWFVIFLLTVTLFTFLDIRQAGYFKWCFLWQKFILVFTAVDLLAVINVTGFWVLWLRAHVLINVSNSPFLLRCILCEDLLCHCDTFNMSFIVQLDCSTASPIHFSFIVMSAATFKQVDVWVQFKWYLNKVNYQVLYFCFVFG